MLHGLGIGTDADQAGRGVTGLACVAAVALAVLVRLAGLRRRSVRRRRTATANGLLVTGGNR